MAYAVVYKDNNNELVVIRTKYDQCAIFFSKEKAVKFMNNCYEKLNFLLDGSPTRYREYFQTYTERKEVSEEDKEHWINMKRTLQIKKISALRFDDGTKLKGSK